MGQELVRSEIAFMRLQIGRQRKEILLPESGHADYLG